AFSALERQVEPSKLGIALLELIDHAQGLQVVLKAPVWAHALVERVLPGVSERGVAQIMGEADRLGKRLVQSEGARDRAGDLRHLDRVGDSGSIQVALVVDEDLRLVDQPAEGVRVNDSITIALELGPVRRLRLGIPAAARLLVAGGVRRQSVAGLSTAAHAVTRRKHRAFSAGPARDSPPSRTPRRSPSAARAGPDPPEPSCREPCAPAPRPAASRGSGSAIRRAPATGRAGLHPGSRACRIRATSPPPSADLRPQPLRAAIACTG